MAVASNTPPTLAEDFEIEGLGWLGDESFRDTIGTLTEDGKRRWLYPRLIKGRFLRWRTVISMVFLGMFFAMPFIYVNGNPFILLDVLHRKFVLFGAPFFPQDFHLFVLALIIGIVFIALFTVAFGRIFCGWVCPQTIFMEMVFRRVERWFEGDAGAQRKLTAQPWNTNKILRRGGKNVVFYVLALVATVWFLMYIIGAEAVFAGLQAGVGHYPGVLAGVLTFAFAFYMVYARFREQVCIVACPYGRLQGVLLGNDSVVVAYDFQRGEPRGKRRKTEAETQGDCIDCKACVAVCPTGIDIRNGTQMECIHCTACIDACDTIMDKIGKPRGLVRYASINAIAKGMPFRVTRRLLAYSALLVVLLVGEGFLLYNRSDVEATLLRQSGSLYKELPNGNVANIYRLQLVNKTTEDKTLRLTLESPKDGKLRLQNSSHLLAVSAEEMAESMVIIELRPENLQGMRTEVAIGVYDGEERVDEIRTNFIGPGGVQSTTP